MTNATTAAYRQPTRGTRSGASRKLLAQKAILKLRTATAGAALEDSFPSCFSEAGDGPSSASAPSRRVGAADADLVPKKDERPETGEPLTRPTRPSAAPAERTNPQHLVAGPITPNPNTVFGTIVQLVAPRGTVTRLELLDLMAGAAFPHRLARPHEPEWCSGYIAGAIRNGFLAVRDDVKAAGAPVQPQEARP